MSFIEFAFMHPGAHETFTNAARQHGLEATWHEDAIGTGATIVRVSEVGLTADIEAKLEALAQQLDEESQNWADSMDDVRLSAVGIVVHLGDGTQSLARVDPNMMRRILSVLTPDEVGQFVAKIADAVENPDNSPICMDFHD
ncbi:MAG: hypothetical protein B7Y40_01895 [Gammaproteobacteria bacterium 28-57-27]|nr:MAG: hypothetical protein B7Y40_01895 [Gammaproteobacteria bacterium 28-57-27]